MKRIIITAMLLAIIFAAAASEYDDLLFAAGLYSDGNLELAKIELEKYLVEKADSKYLGEARYLLGTIYLEEKNYQGAKEQFSELLKSPPSSLPIGELAINLASAYKGCKDYDLAVALLEKQQKNGNENSELNYLLGSSYLEMEQYPAAETNLEKIEEAARTAEIYSELIKVKLKLEKYSEAQGIMNSMMEKFPESEITSYALLQYQQSNLNRQNYSDILKTGFDCIKAGNRYYDQYRLLVGIAYFEDGNYEASMTWLAGLEQAEAGYYQSLNYIKTEDTARAKLLLNKLYENQEGKLKANALFYLASIEPDLELRLQLFVDFINANENNLFVSEALLQAGLTSFKLSQYQEAEKYFERAKSYELTVESLEEADFLLIETSYIMKNYEQAIERGTLFIESYRGSSYIDEVIFKLGVSYYHIGSYPEAEEKFKLLIFNYPESEKTGMSNFYLGEVNLLRGSTEEARKYYSIALEGESDREMSWLRIAQSWFKDGEESKADGALKNVSDAAEYLPEKLLLEGDISFSKKDYNQAIKKYNQLLNIETEQEKKELVISRKAWAYYQMGKYSQASNLYKQLSIRSDQPAEYSFQSATALFSAQMYELALEQYEAFARNFPEHKNAMVAEVGIADCYYNLKEYDKARKQYRRLLTIVFKEELYSSILDGWKWSTEQSGKDFLTEMNDFLRGEVPNNFYFLVASYKAKYLFKQGSYEEAIEQIDELKRNYPYPMKELEYMRAKALKELGSWEEAGIFYGKLFMLYKDAELQYEWSEISIRNGEIKTAVKKLQYAAEKAKKPEYILKLLELEVKHEIADFSSDYKKYIEYLEDIDKEKAEILNAKWLLSNLNFSEAEKVIAGLKKSSYKEIQAQSQYLKGFSLYKQGSYESAVPELLRVRHLFPYLIDIRQQSEELAFRAYIKAGKLQEAENLLDNIRTEISDDKAEELSRLLEESK